MALRYDSSREKVTSNHGRPVWPSFGPKKEELKAQEPAVEAPKAEELAAEVQEDLEEPRALGSRQRLSQGRRWGRPRQVTQVQEPVARTSPGGGRGRRWPRKIQGE